MEDITESVKEKSWSWFVSTAPEWLILGVQTLALIAGVVVVVAGGINVVIPACQKLGWFQKNKPTPALTPTTPEEKSTTTNISSAAPDWETEATKGLRDGSLTFEEVRELSTIFEKEKKSDTAPNTNPAEQDPFIAEFITLATSASKQEREAAALVLEGEVVKAYKILAALAEQDASKTAERWKAAGAIAFNAQTAKAIIAYERAIGTKPDDAEAHNQLGHLYRRIGDLPRAKQAYEQVMALGNQQADKHLQAAASGNLGIIADTQGNLGDAKKWTNKSLALCKELDSKEGMATAYTNLGNIELTRGNIDKAEEWLNKALALNEKLDNKQGMAAAYTNLGIIEKRRDNLDEAEKWLNKALALNEKLDNKQGMANAYANLGSIAGLRSNFDEAEKWLNKALALSEKLGSKESMASAYTNLGNIEKNRGDLPAAKRYWQQAHDLFEQIGAQSMCDKMKSLLDETTPPTANGHQQ